MKLKVILLAVAVMLLRLAACRPAQSEAVIIPTALTCPDCPTIAVTRAIDGDTLDTTSGSIRLFGVDTPQRGERCSKEATSRLAGLAGESVRVESGPRTAGPYGRPLYYAYTLVGHSIDAVLIREGLARAWNRDGQHRNYLVSLEESAKEQRVGCLWGQ